jgi:hypothetical protein
MSKIFNFLSSGTYSSLGANFFRFPFGFGRFPGFPIWGGGERGEQSKMQKAVQDAKNTIYFFNAAQTLEERQQYLDILEFYYYSELPPFEQHEEARKTIEELRVILESNGRNPV